MVMRLFALSAIAGNKMKKEITVTYYSRANGHPEISHSHKEEWTKTELYCPSCGVQNVWWDEYASDYYVGEPHMCLGCGSNWHWNGCHGLPDHGDPTRDSDILRFKLLNGD